MVKLRMVNLFDANDPGLSLDSIDEVFPSGSSVNHTLTDYYRGGSYVSANESILIPTSGEISILDFQGAGDGIAEPFRTHWGAIVTGQSGENISATVSYDITPPAHFAGKHFGCIIVAGGGGAGIAPGGGGGGGSVVYIPKGIPFNAGDQWKFEVGAGGAGGSTGDGAIGGSTKLKVKPSGGSSYEVFVQANGGKSGDGLTNNSGIAGDGGIVELFNTTHKRSQNSIFNDYPDNDDIQTSTGGDGGIIVAFAGGDHGGGGGGVGAFNYIFGPWSSGTVLDPVGGKGFGASGQTPSNGNGGTGVLAAGGGARGPVVSPSSASSTNFQRNSGGGIFDSSYDMATKYTMDRGMITGVAETGFQDAQGIPFGTSSTVTTGNISMKKNVFVGNSNTKNTRNSYFKLTNTNKTDGAKDGGEGSHSKAGGHGIYGGKDGNARETGTTSDGGSGSHGRIYNPKNWGGGGGGAAAFDGSTGAWGVCGGPGIAMIFGSTPSVDSAFLTAEGTELIIPHIFPTADGYFDSDGWH